MTTGVLHVFYDGEAEWYVATSAEDAAAQQRELTGLAAEDQDWTFDALPDGHALTIWCDTSMNPTEPFSEVAIQITKTCAQWAASNGRGILCSTEYWP